MLRDPAKVAVAPPATTAELISQRIIHVDHAAKPAILADVLKAEAIDRALVFTRTKHGADKVVRGLAKAGIAAAAIHGNKSQNQRERVLAAFRAGSVRTLVATDIAARGIDVDGISHVVNYDLPNVPETYVHRIGRTARAGASGIAISLCDAEEAAYLRDIEKLIRVAIPATDRRTGAPRKAKPQGVPHRGEPHRAESHRGKPHRGKPHRGEPHRGEPHRGEPHRGEPHRGEPRHRQDAARPAQRPHAQRPHAQPQPQKRPDDLSGVVFLNRAAKARPDRRPHR
jgi:superfamily II DNA/RNA helicase